MHTYNGNFPLIGVFLPDSKNTGHRIPFKCRIMGDEGQYFTVNAAGLRDTGVGLTIATPKRFQKSEGARVILDGIIYSVSSIQAFIPDKTIGGSIRRKINAEYVIRLE